MSQPHEVMAFRKRLKSAGYADIRIHLESGCYKFLNRGPDVYVVSAVEPLGGTPVVTTLTLTQMYHAFKRERGGILSSAYPKSGGGIPSSASPVSRIWDTVQEVTRSTASDA